MARRRPYAWQAGVRAMVARAVVIRDSMTADRYLETALERLAFAHATQLESNRF
jgi:hypothetical protein